MSRRNKKLAFRKLNALVRYIMAKLPDCDAGELALKVRVIIFRSDFEHYRLYGRPLLPKGFRWIKREDGFELAWRPKGDRYGR